MDIILVSSFVHLTLVTCEEWPLPETASDDFLREGYRRILTLPKSSPEAIR